MNHSGVILVYLGLHLAQYYGKCKYYIETFSQKTYENLCMNSFRNA